MSASGSLTRLTLRALDSFARLLPRKDSTPQHLHTGRRGEEAAYFYLREAGYVIVAAITAARAAAASLIWWVGTALRSALLKSRPALLATCFRRKPP